MSTQFTLYAFDEPMMPVARRYMATSLGYGNEDFVAVAVAARIEQTHETLGGMGKGSRFEVFDSPSFVIDNHHVTFHGDESDEPCVAHDLVSLIGHEMPVIDADLIKRIHDTIPATYGDDARDFRNRLSAWLEGARGRRLWYAFV